MKRVTVTLRHDGGRVRLSTAAETVERAVALILATERAPRGAVLGVAVDA